MMISAVPKLAHLATPTPLIPTLAGAPPPAPRDDVVLGVRKRTWRGAALGAASIGGPAIAGAAFGAKGWLLSMIIAPAVSYYVTRDRVRATSAFLLAGASGLVGAYTGTPGAVAMTACGTFLGASIASQKG